MEIVEDLEAEKWLARWDGTFQWDIHNVEKLSKHDLTPMEVESIFEEETAFSGRVIPDAKTNWHEQRFVTYGRTVTGKLVCLIWTNRGVLLRTISCRRMRREEKRKYENLGRRKNN